MSTDFNPMVNTCFDTFGVTVTYIPITGRPFTAKLIPMIEDKFAPFGETKIQTEGNVFDVRKSEVSAPKQGDRFQFRNRSLSVKAPPRLIDDEGLIWRLECAPCI